MIDWTSGDQPPVEDGPAQHVEGELEVKAATQVATPNAALEDGRYFVSAAGNLDAGPQALGDFQAHVRTIASAQTDLVSRATGLNAAPIDHPGFGAVSLNANGGCAAFSARGLNLGDGFANGDDRP